jgi:hypothetical protein
MSESRGSAYDWLSSETRDWYAHGLHVDCMNKRHITYHAPAQGSLVHARALTYSNPAPHPLALASVWFCEISSVVLGNQTRSMNHACPRVQKRYLAVSNWILQDAVGMNHCGPDFPAIRQRAHHIVRTLASASSILH